MLSKHSLICPVKLWENEPQPKPNVLQYLHRQLTKNNKMQTAGGSPLRLTGCIRAVLREMSLLCENFFFLHLTEPKWVSGKYRRNEKLYFFCLYWGCDASHQPQPWPWPLSLLTGVRIRIQNLSWVIFIPEMTVLGGRMTAHVPSLYVQWQIDSEHGLPGRRLK